MFTTPNHRRPPDSCLKKKKEEEGKKTPKFLVSLSLATLSLARRKGAQLAKSTRASQAKSSSKLHIKMPYKIPPNTPWTGTQNCIKATGFLRWVLRLGKWRACHDLAIVRVGFLNSKTTTTSKTQPPSLPCYLYDNVLRYSRRRLYLLYPIKIQCKHF